MKLIQYLKPAVEKFPIIAGYYRYRRDQLKLNASVEFRSELGFFFNGSESMNIAEFEPEETSIFDSLIGEYDIFINIGANVGYYACKALSQGVDTIAFEPNQHNANLLLKNVKANDFPAEFQLFPLALSDYVGILPMYGAYTGASLIAGWAGQDDSNLVPISSFDRVSAASVKNKKCFVVIDVEGAELDCLRGAASLLSSSDENVFLIEIVLTEHQPNGVNVNTNFYQTFDLMSKFGYTAYSATKDLRPISLKEVADTQEMSRRRIETHNFIFVKERKVLERINFATCAG